MKFGKLEQELFRDKGETEVSTIDFVPKNKIK